MKTDVCAIDFKLLMPFLQEQTRVTPTPVLMEEPVNQQKIVSRVNAVLEGLVSSVRVRDLVFLILVLT